MADHQTLLCVLSDSFGISGTAFNLFQSYLGEWTQSFVYACVATDHLPACHKGPFLALLLTPKTSSLFLISCALDVAKW